MSRVLIVAWSEFSRLIRSKAFIIGVILMPVLFGILILFTGYAEHQIDLEDRSFAVVDYTGALYAPLATAADAFNRRNGTGPDRTGPHFVPEAIDPAGRTLDDLKLDLSDRVRRKDLFAFVVIPESVFTPPAGQASSSPDRTSGPQYYTETIAYDDLPRWLETTLNTEVASHRLAAAGVDAALVRSLTTRTRLGTFGLVERGENGRTTEAREVDELVAIGPPVFFLVLMFLAVMTSGQHLLNAVIEEKMSRISEVLLGSVTPYQLLMGKLAGVSAVAVLLVLVYFAGAVYFVLQSGRWDLLHPGLMIWFVVFLVCAALMYGAIFLSLGSACSSISDAQSLLQPAMMLLILAYLGSFVVVRAPNSGLAIGMSFFPTVTPFALMLRMAVPPGVPFWQAALGIVELIAATGAVLWAASRIFRVGLLMQGKAPTLRELLRWIRADRPSLVTVRSPGAD